MIKYGLNDLIYLMERLRAPEDGCPWDIQQTYRSITPSTVEEAYEVVDAIERNAFDDLKEELGDLLFQVIFYSRLATEEGRFTVNDVIDGLTAKLIRRHPHVFPEGTLASRRQVDALASEVEIKQTWEAIKSQERKAKGKAKIMDDIPVALPAMTRAVKIQKRAAKTGFDWENIQGVVDKLHEELGELEDAVRESDLPHISEEIGDLLFTCVNLARHAKVDPEKALRDSNSKFCARFHKVEEWAAVHGEAIDTLDSETLNVQWENAKRLLANSIES